MRIEKATSDRLEEFYGHPMKKSCYAYVAIEDDEVIGVSGYYNEPSRRVIFLDSKDELKKHPKAMLKTARMIVGEAMSSGLPVYASADENIESAARFLERLGFIKTNGVYVCQAQK